MRIMTVVGNRPQFVKASMFSNHLKSFGDQAPFEEVLIHTGQHYDHLMSEVFFQDLDLPEPFENLAVGSSAPHLQLSEMIEKLGGLRAHLMPDAIMVYGDTNSTLAAAIVAAQSDCPLVHVEAGERLYRRYRQPEEINRVVTDHLASLSLCATEIAVKRLRAEGIANERIKFVGDLMYDVYRHSETLADKFARLHPENFGLRSGQFVLATIHRQVNTNDQERLFSILNALDSYCRPVFLPAHPRLRHSIDAAGWTPSGALILHEPLSYFEFIAFLKNADICVTDSGGVMREAYFARCRSIVPLDSSCWKIITDTGWSREVGANKAAILDAMENFPIPDKHPDELFGDGAARTKIVEAVADMLRSDLIGEDAKWEPGIHLP